MLSDLVAAEAVLAKATCPEDVFGKLLGDSPAEKHVALRQAYHRVVRLVHPDKYSGQPTAISKAQALFGPLAEWRQKAEAKIEAKTYGDHKPHVPPKPTHAPQVIQAPKRKYIVTDLLAQGDLSDLYRCSYTESGAEHHAVFKITQSAADNDLLDNEQRTLGTMYPQGQASVEMYRYLPKLYESFLLRGERGAGNRHVNVLHLAKGYVSLAEVMAAYPSGLDYRDVAWMFNRGLEALWFVHKDKKVVHGALLPTHLLVHPAGHGAKLVDWCYAVPISGKITAISKDYRAYYAPEVLKKEAAKPQTDIYMLAKCMVALLGGHVSTHQMPEAVPTQIQAFLASCLIEAPSRRPDDAGNLREEFDELLARVVGERKYRPLTMPTKM